jgi:hypothetical protein
VSWHVVRWTTGPASGCGQHGPRRAAAPAKARASASGRARTTSAAHGALGRFAIPRGLPPGTYVLTVVASNAHGTGATQTLLLTVP